MPKPHLICIVGPTASGKTAAGVAVAKALSTEVISADARQFYAEMQIGTARPMADELDGIPHHFLGHISIRDHYHVADYERDALAKLDELFAKHDQVVLVGGSGLYIKTLLFGIDPLPEVDPEIRAQLHQDLSTVGLNVLVEELTRLDPQYAQVLDQTNTARVIRALEVCRQTGLPYSQFRTGVPANRPFDFSIYGLDLPRELLYQRINQRVINMVAAGLEIEVLALSNLKDAKALQTIGYREWWPYFDQTVSKDAVIEAIQQNTRRYAKRQMTWFRNQLAVDWFRNPEGLVAGILKSI